MRRLFFGLLFPVWLCTCGPAQDKTPAADSGQRIENLERIFNGAYQDLDAAVIDRLLAEEYAVDYQRREPRRSREQFMSELGQLRLIFPKLRIDIDSSSTEVRGDTVVVEGVRTFNWETGDGPGDYRERFTNKWVSIDEEWQLTHTDLKTHP